MAHAFDTGLALPQRTLIRNGAVTLLSGLLRSNGGYLAAVIPWGGVVRGFLDETAIQLLWQELRGRNPAIAVSVGDSSYEAAGMGGFNFKASIELTLYHYSQHKRSETAGRIALDAVALADDTADPGLEIMMEHAKELLIGQRPALGPTVKQLVPRLEEELQTRDSHTIWAQRYAIVATSTINSKRTLTQLLGDLHAVIRPSDLTPDPVDPVAEILTPASEGTP